ncbi:hypothetical protein EC912_101756 [Luteibacter rhizovicinus]|uniref:Uncharacterized protein n=1 Tax=Luteibacter rhizovicinus TaxID=242606 RepID=A0A4V2W4Z0_9GAMM|nr:hypothetical protein [Luteibacter rhizovicinus]TCV97739.1 hypothetical protein EC912_101756 [Luteibacter rhizovicinus]
MAICVTVNPDGTLATTGQAVSECAGYVMVSGSEYGVYQVVQDMLSVPTPEQAAGWFSGPFILVCTLYVAAKHVGTILSMFDR